MNELWCNRHTNSNMSSSNSRITFIFTISVWIVLISTTIIMYNQVIMMNDWSPSVNTVIDRTYISLKYILIISLIVSIVNLIFHEIKHSNAMSNLFIRRFLPIVRFVATAAIWIIGFFSLLEELHINTNNILAWAWIWWVIFALAGKDIVTNLFWSLSILLSKTFDIGEIIRIQPWRGWPYQWIVEEITLNYTKITNTTGEVIFIPNRLMYSEVIENVTRERFHTYKYVIPFKKYGSNSHDIKQQLKIIEWKIYEYSPIDVNWVTENPNSNDYVYTVSVTLPEEDNTFNDMMRNFLVDFIFADEGVAK